MVGLLPNVSAIEPLARAAEESGADAISLPARCGRYPR